LRMGIWQLRIEEVHYVDEHIGQGKVRGIIVKGMETRVFRIIPLTNIPLTSSLLSV